VQVQEGDLLLTRIRTRGTHKGTFFGIPATGRTFHSTGIHILRYKDGKIAEHWGNSDDLGMMNQLGALVMQGH
jgi:predicted ester cyclase